MSKQYLIFECGLRNLYGRTDTAIVYDTTTPAEKINEWKTHEPFDPNRNPAIVRTFNLDTKEDEEAYKTWMKKHQGEFTWL
jgi:hypothetical protein